MPKPDLKTRPWQLLTLSAQSVPALDAATGKLIRRLARQPQTDLARVAYALRPTVAACEHRKAALCSNTADACATLVAAGSTCVSSGTSLMGEQSVVFMFPGVGDQYMHMAQGLYEDEPNFRVEMDLCFELLKYHTGLNFGDLLYPQKNAADLDSQRRTTQDRALHRLLKREAQKQDQNSQKLNETQVVMPALFAVQYSLARLLMYWGIQPKATIGFSLGEYVAACIAGVFSLEDALLLVAREAELIQKTAGGAMLAISLSEDELAPLLPAKVSISAVNTPAVCVVSGPVEGIQQLQAQLAAQGVACREVRTTHAFHSAMMEPVVAPFRELVKTIQLKPPQIPYVSGVTGAWARAEEVTDPDYWTWHLHRPVRFEQGIRELLQGDNNHFLEVGPGQTLSSYTKQHPQYQRATHQVLSSLPYGQQEESDYWFLLAAVAKLWVAGINIDWDAFYEDRIPPANSELAEVLSETGSRESLPRLETTDRHRPAYVPASNDLERKIAAVWQQVLGIDRIGLNANFFDLGGNSLKGVEILKQLGSDFGVRLTAVALFAAPTVSALARYINEQQKNEEEVSSKGLKARSRPVNSSGDIAIIAMNGRFPGADNLAAFWKNLVDGVESVSFFSDEELLASGVNPQTLSDSRYVKARPILVGADLFDARFFGFSPREAELTDPQQRVLMQCAWEAMELAGYNTEKYDGLVGVFAGMSASTYWFGLRAIPSIARSLSFSQAIAGNDKDSLAPSISYRLNLKGPSVTVQTHCSTSLVATHLACQSLLNWECDMALAAGVSVRAPQKTGYYYQPGGQDSIDGHTRSFDSRAKGTILGEGVGVVVLKRLEDALADGDYIHAVIKGSAINNDGACKAGFAAPSVDGQAAAVLTALDRARVDAGTISYVEAHGSATEIGDPIEVAALTKAFRSSNTDVNQYCPIGSLKANVGHPDKAAGVAGLIKASLVLQHKLIPPNPHFEAPNPQIDFENSPFFVNKEPMQLQRSRGGPLRAGVNSLGMGGTNAHVILEEAPPRSASSASRPWQILMLSCRTPSALDTATVNLTSYLKNHPESNLADIAFTLQVGRRAMNHRRTILCRDREDALAALDQQSSDRILSGSIEIRNRIVTFMFPGLGDQYEGIASELYENEPIFRQHVDECSEALTSHLGLDLREVLFPPSAKDQTPNIHQQHLRLRQILSGHADSESRIHRTSLAQPAVFVIEYALARLLMSWEVLPQAMIGYSLGEYVAATLAGVISLQDALRLVAFRARLIDDLASGTMLAVPLSEEEIRGWLDGSLSVAASNTPMLTVVSGTADAISELENKLRAKEIVSRRLPVSHAFHSRMMEPLEHEFLELMNEIELNVPTIAYISNVTGTWIRAEEARDARYWFRHMCQTVRFVDGVEELLKEEDRVFIEVGPGQNLSSFIKQHPNYREKHQAVVAVTRNFYESQSDQAFLMESLGKMWLAGVNIGWDGFYAGESRHRVPLPTYPFERQRYWLEAHSESDGVRLLREERKPSNDWFYASVWRKSAAAIAAKWESGTGNSDDWLIFVDQSGAGQEIARRLRERRDSPIVVEAGARFEDLGDQTYRINPEQPSDYRTLLSKLTVLPRQIVHLWALGDREGSDSPLDALAKSETSAFYSLLYLAQALGNRNITQPLGLTVVSSHMQEVTGTEVLLPEKALMVGPCRVIPAEYPDVFCRSIDVQALDINHPSIIADQVMGETSLSANDPFVAYRNGERWIPTFELVKESEPDSRKVELRSSGVYLITGGLGGIGLAMADYLARTLKPKLVLVGRSQLPPKSEWPRFLADDGQKSIGRKIRSIQALEAAGAEVLVLKADVADIAQMRAAVQSAIAAFGTIHGVIHAAGLAGNGLMQLKAATAAAKVLAPKVQGTLVLESALQDIQLDFLALFSSITSITGGGPGQVDYCGANAFLDLYARANRSAHRRTVSIDWCEWQWDAWQEGLLGFSAELQDQFKRNREKFGLTFEEGTEAFSRALILEQPQVIVCTRDLNQLMAESRALTIANIFEKFGKGNVSVSAHSRPVIGTAYVPARSDLEAKIAEVWQGLLGIGKIGAEDNFFDLGGNSLIGLQVMAELRKKLDREISPVALYEAPTVRALAKYVNPALSEKKSELRKPAVRAGKSSPVAIGEEIAIIGMAGRFPGAANVEALWQNLVAGVESISFFSEEELLAAGVDPSLLQNPDYVRAAAVIDGIDLFDATLFGYSPVEAEIMDPQHRVFLECAWEALENAGYDSERYEGAIGVFAGSNISTYLLRLHSDSRTFQPYNTMMMGINFNSSDSLTTKVSYKLNLKGPSVAVQTFCSTSAVAMHMACKSLQIGDCDMALAGGVRIKVPQTAGYIYESGAIDSPDGHCRAFDAKGKGALVGNGVAIVLLKRLEDAVQDRDHIYAVIKGSAINNDGSLKVGYTAPSVDIQAEAIASALAQANVDPADISFVEAHGTGTEMGDPIEMLALAKAFGPGNDRKQFCAIGSVKTNLGHLDRAAGTASMIKTAMALERQLIPPSLNFDEPNPNIDFANSPFYVNTRLTEWKRNGKPRRAAMNALGIGGTNVHFVLEEAPEVAASKASRPWQLLLLSAKSSEALDAATANFAAHLKSASPDHFADVAYTLQVGRKVLGYKRAIVCKDSREAVKLIEGGDARQIFTRVDQVKHRPVVMMFSGVGEHYQGMTAELYREEPVFRDEVDRCCELLMPQIKSDLRHLIFGEEAHPENIEGIDLRKMLGRQTRNGNGATQDLTETDLLQPAVFVIDYALGKLLTSWGVKPQAFAGYSIGEYCAACFSGVLSLENALMIVAERARLIQGLARGAMLAVSLPEGEARSFLKDELDLAAVNGPRMSVVSGSAEHIDHLERELQQKEIVYRRVETTHAFHSRMMEPIFQKFIALLKTVELKEPQIPYVSNVTGTWIKAEEATDPGYWARHMCQTVRFSDDVRTLFEIKDAFLLEVGPSQALSSLVKLHPEFETARSQLVVSTVKSQYDRQSDLAFLLTALGKLWLCGVDIDWNSFYSHEQRRRVPLPTYPFERHRYWVEPKVKPGAAKASPESQDDLERIQNVSDWFYVPVWKQSQPVSSLQEDRGTKHERCWLLLLDDSILSTRIKDELEWRGEDVIAVRAAGEFARQSDFCYAINPKDKLQFGLLLKDLESRGKFVNRIVHLWNISVPKSVPPDRVAEEILALGFYALMFLAQALGNRGDNETQMTVLTAGAHKVSGDEELHPERATAIGPCRVIPQEYTTISCRNIDVVIPEAGSSQERELVSQLLDELTEGWSEPVVACRGGLRWVQIFESVKIQPAATRPALLKTQGVYLITGGLGGIGLAIADHLARNTQAKLVLVGRKGLPPRQEWQRILDDEKTENSYKDAIRQIITIEAMGSEVLVLSADVSCLRHMQEVVRQVKERFGYLNGIFHSAGVPGAGLIQLKTQEAAARVLAPKLQGTLVLEQVFKDTPVDFVVLISSMTSVVGGGPGQLDYCAANAFLDAYAIASNGPGRRVVSIDWGEWQWDAWQEGLLGFDPRIAAFFRENRRKFGVSFEEGMDALDRILMTRFPNVVVSTREFNAFIRLCKNFTVAGILREADKRTEAESAHPRPVLGTSYVAPRTEAEQQIASIWQETLRIEQIGIHDNFFELGGNSLLGIRLIAEMRRHLKVEMAMYVLYEAPTVSSMATFAETQGNHEHSLDTRHSRGQMRRNAQQRKKVAHQ